MIETIARRDPLDFRDVIEICIVDRERKQCAMPITVETRDEGGRITPAFTLEPEQAQQLMNSLWECGIRPAQAAGSAGQLAAVQHHLQDMRCLAFGIKNQQEKLQP
jgi:hypothetical protein